MHLSKYLKSLISKYEREKNCILSDVVVVSVGQKLLHYGTKKTSKYKDPEIPRDYINVAYVKTHVIPVVTAH